MIENIVTFSRLVANVALAPNLTKVANQILKLWNELLIAVPGYKNFFEGFKSVAEKSFDNVGLLENCIVEAAEVKLIL